MNMNKVLVLFIITLILLLRVIAVSGQSEEGLNDVAPQEAFNSLDDCRREFEKCSSERQSYALGLQNGICPKGKNILFFVLGQSSMSFFTDFIPTCPPMTSTEPTALPSKHLDAKMVSDIKDAVENSVNATIAEITSMNDKLFNGVTDQTSQLCDTAVNYIKRLTVEKKRGLTVSAPCVQYWEVQLQLEDIKRFIKDELKAALKDFKIDVVQPLPISKNDSCGLTLTELEDFFSISNCIKNPWTCIPWAVLILVAFGALVALIVNCIMFDCQFGYQCRKRRGNLRPRNHVRFNPAVVVHGNGNPFINGVDGAQGGHNGNGNVEDDD